MKRKVRIGLTISIVIVVLVLLTSPRIRQLLPGSGSGRTIADRDQRLPVSAIVVKPELVSNKILATGTVLANEEVDLRSETYGKIERILFSEGSKVRKGDILIKIDDSELKAQLAKLESQKKVAQEKERRRKQLFEKQSISPEEYEMALNELNAINAEIQLVGAKIMKTEIRAPFDGLIGLRYVSEGSYVDPTIKIASLQNIMNVKVDFAIPEKYVHVVKKGQSVSFSLSGQKMNFTGKIYAIEPKIDPVTRNVLIRALSQNENGRILPGAFAEVELVIEQIDDALMIPTQALVPDLQGQKVFVFRSGVAQESRVEIGLRTETKIQVTQGIQPNDTVLTSGLLQVIPGTPVKLSEVQ